MLRYASFVNTANRNNLAYWDACGGGKGLEEIVVATASGSGHSALVVGHGGEDVEAGLEVLAEVHDGGDVAAAVAVVGGTPHGDDGFILEVPLSRRYCQYVCVCVCARR